MRLAGARLRGNTAEAKSLELELEGAKTQRRKLDIITSYIDARKSEIKSAEDLNRIQAEAARYANATLEAERQRAESEKWLAGEIEKNKTAQRDMELEILRLRASGDEVGARELEERLRISQIASEIFETTRREGMSREELGRLQASANEQAREKYELEKSITDEAERQNLAKDAQAKIEDILLTNKIEQLKAEGKLTEARELEREREIKRTLAGMKGLSEADRESIASTIARPTNTATGRKKCARLEAARPIREAREALCRQGAVLLADRNQDTAAGPPNTRAPRLRASRAPRAFRRNTAGSTTNGRRRAARKAAKAGLTTACAGLGK